MDTFTSDEIALLFYSLRSDFESMQRMDKDRFFQAKVQLTTKGYITHDYNLTPKGQALFVLNKCNRESCDSGQNASWFHTQLYRYYCPRCARQINEHNPGLCVLANT